MAQRFRLFTIGFTRKSAAEFFGTLQSAGAQRVLDTRLSNVSQLAGFAKKADLPYFLSLFNIDYVHRLDLAPTRSMLDAYRQKQHAWPAYERKFRALIQRRHIERRLDHATLDRACLLCSEPTPEHCHRRLVAEYLQRHWPQIHIIHL